MLDCASRLDAMLQGAESHETNDHMVNCGWSVACRCRPVGDCAPERDRGWAVIEVSRPVSEEQVSEWSLLDSFTGPRRDRVAFFASAENMSQCDPETKRNRPAFPLPTAPLQWGRVGTVRVRSHSERQNPGGSYDDKTQTI